MQDRLRQLGWKEVEVIDEDLGCSAAGTQTRTGAARGGRTAATGPQRALCALMRTIPLAKDVDVDQTDARFDRAVLTLCLPRMASSASASPCRAILRVTRSASRSSTASMRGWNRDVADWFGFLRENLNGSHFPRSVFIVSSLRC